MKHKHADMIKAKADNMALVVFVRMAYSGDWVETSEKECLPSFHPDNEYFLCLPQHNENGQCLHWLNGGEIEMQSDEAWMPVEMFKNTMPWHPLSIFMEDYTAIRIKPRKEKLWIGCHKYGHTTTKTYATKDDAKADTVDHYKWQFIEIEVEF